MAQRRPDRPELLETHTVELSDGWKARVTDGFVPLPGLTAPRTR